MPIEVIFCLIGLVMVVAGAMLIAFAMRKAREERAREAEMDDWASSPPRGGGGQLMADVKQCWVRTTHEQHGWTEVDGKVQSLVDASTVLQVPEGSKIGYHHCDGVPDLLPETKAGKYLRQDHRDSVYEVKSTPFGNAEVVTERRTATDAVYERVIILEPWREVQRLTCYCCSCGDFNTDWACRNHNMGFGMRPCEVHGVEGQREVNPETDEEGEMPASVQAERKRQREAEGEWHDQPG